MQGIYSALMWATRLTNSPIFMCAHAVQYNIKVLEQMQRSFCEQTRSVTWADTLQLCRRNTLQCVWQSHSCQMET